MQQQVGVLCPAVPCCAVVHMAAGEAGSGRNTLPDRLAAACQELKGLCLLVLSLPLLQVHSRRHVSRLTGSRLPEFATKM